LHANFGLMVQSGLALSFISWSSWRAKPDSRHHGLQPTKHVV